MASKPFRSPRNHWYQIEDALRLLGGGDPSGAWRIFEGVRYSSFLPPDALGGVEKLIRDAMADAPRLRIERPSDYLYDPEPLQPGSPMLRLLHAKRKLLARSPYEMVLPPITGNANDFGFIADSIGRVELNGPLPALKLRLVILLNDAAEVSILEQNLAAQADWLRRTGAVSLVIHAPKEVRPVALPLPASWHSGLPWQLDPATQMTRIAADSDALLFLPVQALEDPFLLERVLRYNALSSSLCLMFEWLPPHGAEAPFPKLSVLSDQQINKSAQGKPTTFRSLIRLGFAISTKQFRKVGGFDPRFESEFFACRELGFRLYNHGIYFMPLALRAPVPAEVEPPVSRSDRSLLVALVPHPWDRKISGRFEVPKVSIHIPAFRAARYLGDAIDSVLSQDYEDLEICVADDGSPDSTLKILESYSHEPRLRYESGPNGGIGHGSNRAIRMSRGIYVGQLDSDDRLKPGAIRRLAEFLDQNQRIGCVYASCERIGPQGNYLRDEYNYHEFSREKMMLTSIAHHFRMFRRQAWERTQGFREDIVNGVDYDIFLKMSEVSEFQHINEILYQRRWHGENTSHVNEAFQTENTYRVQTEALKRTGLDRYWQVSLPDPSNPRKITYRRKGAGLRAFVWPDYSRSNPYQRLLYQKAARQGEILSGDIEAALRAIREVPPGGSGAVSFHLHWLNKVIEGSATLGEAADKAQAFLDRLRAFRNCGGRLVWTVHNSVSHDAAFPQVEHQLAREIVALADAVHIHSAASLPEIARSFSIPASKLHVLPHGSYIGSYPDFVERAAARRELGLPQGDEVMLFLGQIRPYKGLGALLESFAQLAQERPRLRLVLAGRGDVATILEQAALPEALRARIHVFNRFIDDMELQLFLRAADFSVLPYRNILTSGSLLLSLSFGVPAIVTASGMTSEILAGEDAGLLYPADGGNEALSKVIREMLDRLDAGTGPQMSSAARARAAKEVWQDISPVLFGENT